MHEVLITWALSGQRFDQLEVSVVVLVATNHIWRTLLTSAFVGVLLDQVVAILADSTDHMLWEKCTGFDDIAYETVE